MFRYLMSVDAMAGPIYLRMHYVQATQILMKNRSGGG